MSDNVGTHGSCVRPDDPCLRPDGPRVRPDGPCVRPDDPCLRPDGPCVRPDDPCLRPDDPCLRPDGAMSKPCRKSPRAIFHDYSDGDYFVTFCTERKEHLFGEIRNGEMKFTEIGEYCDEQFRELSKHYPYAETILYVVMPNHIHAIISIHNVNQAAQPSHEPARRTHGPCVPTVRTALSVVIGGLKRAVTMFARRNNIEFGWQSRYYDHIIRNMDDYDRIAEYIENNVASWADDCFYR